MSEKILFVDDEPALLEGVRRSLHRDHHVDIAIGGIQGLTALKETGPYAVVISDMRMPGMNGAAFLAKVREIAPDTVRMLLTGYTDLNDAMAAVNEGHIFRFLTKPCPTEVLLQALASALDQYRLITGERELLEKTLMGSVKVLADVLSTASPEAFGRSLRISHYVRHIMAKFQLSSPWRFEVAATLSQLGCVTLDTDLLQQAYSGTKLTAEAQGRFDAHPLTAMKLLENIPRLETVAWMIGQQLKTEVPKIVPGMPEPSSREISFGARLLKLAVAYEDTRMRYSSNEDILARLRKRSDEFEPELIEALNDLRPDGLVKELRKVAIAKLRTGMILDQDIRNHQGVLLVGKGQEITSVLMMRIENFARAGMIEKEVMALVAG